MRRHFVLDCYRSSVHRATKTRAAFMPSRTRRFVFKRPSRGKWPSSFLCKPRKKLGSAHSRQGDENRALLKTWMLLLSLELHLDSDVEFVHACLTACTVTTPITQCLSAHVI
eukprot:6193070-Pleurochrysis_carterae.AAC.4